MRHKGIFRRGAALFACLALCGGPLSLAEGADAGAGGKPAEALPVARDLADYQAYLGSHADAAAPAAKVTVRAADYLSAEGTPPELLAAYEGEEALLLKEEGRVTWQVTVPETGLYAISARYCPYPGKEATAERELSIDGAVPFEGARILLFPRLWENASAPGTDARGNQYRPQQRECYEWRDWLLSGTSEYYDDPYRFYLTAGEHTLSLYGAREPLALASLTLCQPEEVPSYADYLAAARAEGAREVTAGETPIRLQGEDAARKSHATLYPLADHSSPADDPYDLTRNLLNVIGGENWRYNGSFIEWDVNVQTAGLYRLSFRALQNFKSGAYSARTIWLDGRIPFEEARSLRFSYSMDWQMVTLENADGPCLLYLPAGRHTLRLEVTLGERGELMRDVGDCIARLNTMYRKIMMITGAYPDTLRDYNLFKNIPELEATFAEVAGQLTAISGRLLATGQKGEDSANMERLALQLESFVKDPGSIPARLASFNSNLSDLSAWQLSASEQALTVDYLLLTPPETALPPADAPWWKKLASEVAGLVLSFFNDYDTISTAADTENAAARVSLWLGTGRDQAVVLKSLFDNAFTRKTHIAVDLQLVNMDVLLRAVSAGQGPDLALFQDQTTPVQYAFRHALYDLSRFDDLDEVLARFSDSAVEPFRIGESVYALPEQQTFDMMFCRTDILEELGLKAPDTWKDLYQLLPELQKNNMDVGLPSPFQNAAGGSVLNTAFLSLLYQNGGEVYNEARSRCMLDSDVGVRSFLTWTELYSRYKIPQKMDMLTRFRTGEAPIVITTYTFYNQLTISAPEISGLWEMMGIPATKRTDGTLDRSVGGTVSGCVMFDNARDKDATWELMKWWTDTEAQVLYGREMEALQGPSGRWPTANRQAMQQLPWSVADTRTLLAQWENAKPNPEVAGGYYTGRNVDNAIRLVINGGEDAKETLLDYVKEINDEITLRRKEFGLSAQE